MSPDIRPSFIQDPNSKRVITTLSPISVDIVPFPDLKKAKQLVSQVVGNPNVLVTMSRQTKDGLETTDKIPYNYQSATHHQELFAEQMGEHVVFIRTFDQPVEPVVSSNRSQVCAVPTQKRLEALIDALLDAPQK